MNFNPLRRSPLKKKPRAHKETMPWRRPKVRLDGREMAALRQDCCARAAGRCENSIDGHRCQNPVNWLTGQLAHIVSRGRGGSDAPDNCLFVCVDCHREDTRNRRKLAPHVDWIAAA